MKIIFLDIDGPILTTRGFQAGFSYGADPVAVRVFNNLPRLYPDLQYVISSTWRMNETYCKKMLENIGFNLNLLHSAWRTYISPYRERGLEVEAWLDTYGKDDVENYLIIDDSANDLYEEQKQYHLVKVDAYNGLTHENIIQIVEFFGKTSIEWNMVSMDDEVPVR